MARRPEHLRRDDPVPKAIEQHMLALGLVASWDYFDWCRRNGFESSLEKSRDDLREERDTHAAAMERRKRHSRLHKKPKAFLKAVCMGDLSSEEIDRPNFKQAAAEIERSSEAEEVRASLLDMLVAVTKHDDMAFEAAADQDATPFVRGLIKMHDRKALWLRPLEDWKPKSKNRDRRFGELAHHLFDRYGDVPRFMEAVWLRNDRASWRYRDWYIHLGRGHNLRSAKSRVPITKKIAHHFLMAPDKFTVEQALRWGQLKALGASDNAVRAVAATRVGQSFDNEDFWYTVLRFIADNPMLDPRQIGPVIDYLQNQRFDPVEVEVAPGQWRRLPPPQPGLSMNGRTVETLMKQVADWHESLGEVEQLSTERYAEAAFDGLAVERKKGGQSVHWVIRQLRSARDLQSEGKELRHCVASYHWSCARGDCTIWSLSVSTDGSSYERRQTIEVDHRGTIVQCRGRANRDPKPEEWSIVEAWARNANLGVAAFM